MHPSDSDESEKGIPASRLHNNGHSAATGTGTAEVNT